MLIMTLLAEPVMEPENRGKQGTMAKVRKHGCVESMLIRDFFQGTGQECDQQSHGGHEQ